MPKSPSARGLPLELQGRHSRQARIRPTRRSVLQVQFSSIQFLPSVCCFLPFQTTNRICSMPYTSSYLTTVRATGGTAGSVTSSGGAIEPSCRRKESSAGGLPLPGVEPGAGRDGGEAGGLELEQRLPMDLSPTASRKWPSTLACTTRPSAGC